MKLIMTMTLTAAAVFAVSSTVEARYDTRSHSHFAHKHCKTDACYEKHPSGVYTFPYHHGHRH